MAVLFLVLLEAVGRLALPALGVSTHPYHERPDLVPARPGAPPWWNPYRREYAESHHLAWRPYVYWRRRPYHGQFINVGDEGLRYTRNRTPEFAPGQKRVFFFGGSSTWGTGVRDAYTAASQTAAALPDAWVSNFGETGYVNTQEMVALTLELRQGNVPDMAVFCDGINEAWTCYQTGRAGEPENEEDRAAEFNMLYHWNVPVEAVRRSPLLGLADLLAQPLRASAPPRPWRVDDARRTAAANAVVDAYYHNVKVINALARQYGFRTVFFWQPMLFLKPQCSAEELVFYNTFERIFPRGIAFYSRVYEVFSRRAGPERPRNVHDLSHLFDHEPGTVFVDHYHLSEEATTEEVKAMLPILRMMLPRPTAARPITAVAGQRAGSLENAAPPSQ